MHRNLSRRCMLTLAAAALLGACGSTPSPADPGDQRLSLVFGYFDMREAPSAVEWVSLKPYHDADHGSYRVPGEADGLFMHVAIRPGSYQVDRFGGSSGLKLGKVSLFGSPHEYDFGSRGRNDTAVRIVQPGVYFLGAYAYVPHKRGWLEADQFEMRRLAAPGERELLLRVQRLLESEATLKPYTRQLAMVRSRVAELSK